MGVVFLESLSDGHHTPLLSSPNPIFHLSENFIISARFFLLSATVQRLHDPLQCFNGMITDIDMKLHCSFGK